MGQGGDEKTIVDFNRSGKSAGAGEFTQTGFERPMPGGRLKSANGFLESNRNESVSNLSHHHVASAQWQLSPVSHSISGKYTSSDNPLLSAAQLLLNELVSLQLSTEQKDIYEYREELAGAIREFEFECSSHPIDEELIVYSRYILCTALDEMVNKTPWSGKGEWNRHSLLAQYHGETGGGEKFFELLDHLLVHAARHLFVLELIFVCLNLGFEGKYHVLQRGHAQLESIKDNLFQVIRLQKGDPEPQLSENWRGITDKRNPMSRYIPAWVFVVVSTLVGIGIYSGFNYLIVENANQVIHDIQQIPTDYSELMISDDKPIAM
ncbi:MAG: type IVB secretion system protein IcmH/DotU [Pseudomonadales bacterium]|nr:type IVB secretion system protein IcmH/DotU [Pseudomonadales bacterium]